MIDYAVKSIELDLKAPVSDKGTFAGYGSIFNTKDQGGDIVEPGAFAASLKEWQKSGRVVPMLWQHNTGEPIGAWPDLKEDEVGLFGSGELWLDDAPYARIARRGMQTKTITGLSIGYRVRREKIDRQAGVNRLQDLQLVEISVVTRPMHDDARIDSVKAKLLAGEKPTIRQFEEILREHGFSRKEAEHIALRGFRDWQAGDGDADHASKVAEALKAFSLNV